MTYSSCLLVTVWYTFYSLVRAYWWLVRAYWWLVRTDCGLYVAIGCDIELIHYASDIELIHKTTRSDIELTVLSPLHRPPPKKNR